MRCSSKKAALIALAFSIMALWMMSGCASQRDPDGSNLPWTELQPWERQPMMPGMN